MIDRNEERARALRIVEEIGWEAAVVNDNPGQTTYLYTSNPYYNNAFLISVCVAMRQRLITMRLDPLTPLEHFALDALLDHIACTR